ncbi:hypothetical protein PR048_030012 [Dryococelus australis]|uniref:Uncharacterized protein n=1 Tax=Dryococelus australis TaxID=614101 RepID=A0ABQ9GBM4_9NEOP|nr:hypothetical protein PR048_030012 [Dryococelus australis]
MCPLLGGPDLRPFVEKYPYLSQDWVVVPSSVPGIQPLPPRVQPLISTTEAGANTADPLGTHDLFCTLLCAANRVFTQERPSTSGTPNNPFISAPPPRDPLRASVWDMQPARGSSSLARNTGYLWEQYVLSPSLVGPSRAQRFVLSPSATALSTVFPALTIVEVEVGRELSRQAEPYTHNKLVAQFTRMAPPRPPGPAFSHVGNVADVAFQRRFTSEYSPHPRLYIPLLFQLQFSSPKEFDCWKSNIQQLKEEIKEKLPASGTATSTLRHSHKKSRPPPPPVAAPGTAPGDGELEIREPSELLVGVPATLTTQWRHHPHVLLSSTVTYVANPPPPLVVERLACSPPTMAGHRIFARGNRAGRCFWSASFLGNLPFPPLHSPLHTHLIPPSQIGSQDLAVKSLPNLFTRPYAFWNITCPTWGKCQPWKCRTAKARDRNRTSLGGIHVYLHVCRLRGGLVVRLLASHPGERGSITGAAVAGSSHVGIVSGISRLPRPFIPVLLHTHLASPSSALKISMLRAARVSSLTPRLCICSIDREPAITVIDMYRVVTAEQNVDRYRSVVLAGVLQYLGSTVVKELRGTESTKKSIQKLKKATKEPKSSPDIVLAISYHGVQFLNPANQVSPLSRPFTRLDALRYSWSSLKAPVCLELFEAEKRGSDKGDTAMRSKFAIAAKACFHGIAQGIFHRRIHTEAEGSELASNVLVSLGVPTGLSAYQLVSPLVDDRPINNAVKYRVVSVRCGMDQQVEPRVFRGLSWQQAWLDSPLYTRDIIVCLLVAVIKTAFRPQCVNILVPPEPLRCLAGGALKPRHDVARTLRGTKFSRVAAGLRVGTCRDGVRARDPQHPTARATTRTIAYITKDHASKSHYCHVFCVQTMVSSRTAGTSPCDQGTGVRRVHAEVDFAIGSQFITHALDDSDPIADLQRNETFKHSLTPLLPAYYWLTVKRGVPKQLPSNHNSGRKEHRDFQKCSVYREHTINTEYAHNNLDAAPLLDFGGAPRSCSAQIGNHCHGMFAVSSHFSNQTFEKTPRDQATEVILTLGQAFEVAYQMALRDQAPPTAPPPGARNGHTRSQSANQLPPPPGAAAAGHARSLSVDEARLNGQEAAGPPNAAAASTPQTPKATTPSQQAPIVQTEEL